MPFWLVSIGKSNREQIETKKIDHIQTDVPILIYGLFLLWV